MRKIKTVDRPLLIIIIMLVTVGLFVFFSAALGLLAQGKASFSSVAFSQITLGVIGGGIAMFLVSKIHYRFWKAYAYYLFAASVLATLAVFIPGVGMTSGGATRWVVFGGFSFQPVELLKIGVILALSAFFAQHYKMLKKDPRMAMIIFGAFLVFPIAILLKQPDTGSLAVIIAASGSILFVAGARWKEIGIALLIAVIALGGLLIAKPYVLDRFTTFLDGGGDKLGAGYQTHQILISVGSGSVYGRGFGQSVQKFGYLPQPIGDSIFAVAAEEFGFIGSAIIILLFLAFGIRSLWLSTRTPDYFSALLVVGVAMLIVVQSFFNIAAMLGVVPLSGLPLVFISHGGTAMFVSLAGLGIILNISKYRKLR